MNETTNQIRCANGPAEGRMVNAALGERWPWSLGDKDHLVWYVRENRPDEGTIVYVLEEKGHEKG